MAVIKFFLYNLIIKYYCLLQRRCVDHDIVMSGRHRSTLSREYVFLSSFIKNKIFLSIVEEPILGSFCILKERI